MNSPISLAEIVSLLPEICLVLTALAICIIDLICDDPKLKRRALLSCVGLGIAAALLALTTQSGQPAHSIFHARLAIDPFSTWMKFLFIATLAISTCTSQASSEINPRTLPEYYFLLFSICLGMCLMASANDALVAYLGIELVSIVSYAMAGFRLRDRQASEAALKYVLYGGAASGCLLFGLSLLYGLFGTTYFAAMHSQLAAWDLSAASGTPVPAVLALITALSLVFVGMGYKIAAVPFHMWSPDVYEGAPTPFTAFLSVGPKAAGFALLVRFLLSLLAPPGPIDISATNYALTSQGTLAHLDVTAIFSVLGIIAALTMSIGNLGAIAQSNVKRLLAYSSIAHTGYMLLGLLVLSERGLHALLLYICFYYFMNMGAFTVCQAIRDSRGSCELKDFNGLSQHQPLLAFCMLIFLLSLTGLPPLAGFIGKFYLFSALLEHNQTSYWVLAIIAVINSAVSLFYYLNIAKHMYLRDPDSDTPPPAPPRIYAWVCSALMLPTLIFGLYWTPISRIAKQSIALHRSAPAVSMLSQQPRSNAR